jgi:RTX calcium-binding nonapeptide repeat (4 copies)
VVPRGISISLLCAAALAILTSVAIGGANAAPQSAGPAATAPVVSRSAADPGQLQLTIPSSSGEFQYIVVQPNGSSARLLPDPDRAPPPTFWSITAPDCSQDPQSKIVTCSAPVTSLLVNGGDGDEGVDADAVTFGVVGFGGGGADYLGGGRTDDILDGGPGPDMLAGDLGDDQLLGGTEDDELFGGPGADRLTGAEGRDRMFGQGQLDQLLARDGAADRRLDCGPGSDERERAKVDPSDPKAKSC